VSYLNIQFSTLVVLVSGVVRDLICLKVLAEITNLLFAAMGTVSLSIIGQTNGHTKDKISFFNAPQKE
jgi:hypothetical protein